jgi:hypothetical protein
LYFLSTHKMNKHIVQFFNYEHKETWEVMVVRV